MKVIKPSFEYFDEMDYTPVQFIEKIGRTCYKSEDKITEDSATSFVYNLAKHGHYAMLEHYWIHLKVREPKGIVIDSISEYFDKRNYNPLKYMEIDDYTMKVKEGDYDIYSIISAPLRVFIEMDKYDFNEADIFLVALMSKMKQWSNMLFSDKEVYYKGITEDFDIEFFNKEKIMEIEDWNFPVKKHITHTYKIICDRGVSHELVRHRPCNFAQESTRYANYTKEQFGSEITVIQPFFYKLDGETCEQYKIWYDSCKKAEESYICLIEKGSTPQEARSVLPNSLKTEIIITANELEWQHICDLRAKQVTGKAHPQMVEIMQPIYEDLRNRTDERII